MICVSSFLRGEPKDYESFKKKDAQAEESCTKRVPHEIERHRVAYFTNYEQYSTFTPDKYDRLAMPFPFYDGDHDE